MYLSSIDLFGFKSFAARTHIAFAPGVTAIVGPNGCGKSNIVDAVRWVLGEQREAALRSERMENVIFGGTGKRRPLGMAEISLTLHDTDGILPIEFDEVTVTRRLFRSGKSEYLLNKTPCRLRDMVDLFMGTGIGPDAYSIMELKMVEDVLSENPEETRRLLDEALGITRYKQRRKEALRKLTDAHLDRDRATDILSEVERQGKALKRQVARVKAYKRLQEKATRVRAALVLARVTQLESQLQPLAEHLRDFQVELENQTAELASAEAGTMRIESEILQAEENRQQFTSLFNAAQTHYQSASGELSKLEEGMRANSWQVERNRETRAKVEAELVQLAKRIDEADKSVLEHQGSLPELKALLEKRQRGFAAADGRFKEARAVAQRSREALDDLREKQAQSIRLAEQRIATIASLQERRSNLQFRQNEQASRLTEFQSQMADLQADLDEKNRLSAQSEENFAEIDRELEALKTHIRQKERDLDLLAAQRQQIGVQIEHLQELHRRSSPIYAAGGALAAKFPKDLSATLTDELQVEDRYIKAVETALHALAFSRVLENHQSFGAILEYLAKEKSGRAALLVGDPPQNDPDAARAVAAQAGAEALADAITGLSAVSRWARFLLKDVVLVASREALKQMSPKAARERLVLVTPDGELTDGNGFWVLGATRDEAPRVIGLSARRKALERDLQKAETELENIRQSISRLQADLNETQAKLNQAEAIRKESKQALDDAAHHRMRLEAQLVSADLLLEQMRRELKEIEDRLAELAFAAKDEPPESPPPEDQLRLLLSEQRGQGELEADALEEREQARTELEEIQIRYERAASEISRARDHLAQLQQRGEQLQAELQSLVQNDRLATERLAELQKTRQAQLEKVAEASAELEELRQKLAEFDSSRMELQESQRHAGSAVREIRNHIDELSQQVHQGQLQSVELEATLREERKKLEGVDLEGLADEPGDPEVLARIERKILALEPLNLAAEKEYQELLDRQNFLHDQLQDLSQAEADLQQTVATLNREAKERFETGFQRIRENFQRIFLDVFEGGKADLSLANDDPLESNIELLAAPPGKRIGSLTLLSGGEKALTAISLLFAIYLEKPSPFCILDEVDAPLDDENTLRFCRILQSFSQKTQFLVITHNKRTMTEAQQLLGVTMEEEGISKVVPVKLN